MAKDMVRYWLVKTEPEVYSFERLLKEKRTHWDGVRNFQARKNLMAMAKGDLVFVYHSQGPRTVVGLAKVVKEHYPDTNIKPDQPKGDWVMVDLQAVEALVRPVSLDEIKRDPQLKDIALVRQSRLSVMELTKAHFDRIMKLSHSKSVS
jgi:predicted RNA-binding protein with PUA-like domain